MNNIGILYHPLNDDALALAQKLSGFLESKGIGCWLCSAWDGQQACEQLDGTELVLTIGGDGTILRAAQLASPQSIPITGINLGRLGFLTELAAGEAMDKLPELLAGGGWTDERAMLEVELDNRSGQDNDKLLVLNDAVIARGEVARIIYVEAAIDDQPLTTYKADGVITATATGSTGYALAAGGPVLHPQAEQILLVPIMPHLSLPYSLVLPEGTVVKLRVGNIHKAMLSIDGHISLPLESNSSITIKRSRIKTRFLRIGDRGSFYSTLEQKLKG